MTENNTIVIRHNANSVGYNLALYVLRQGAVMLLMSTFVTLVMMVVLWPSLIRPILTLRDDLTQAGQSIQDDNLQVQFTSKQLHRRDELGDVILTFQSMYDTVCQAILARKQGEASLRQHNTRIQEYITEVEQLTQVAVALELGNFEIDALNTVAQRSDELGQLARMLQRAAQEVRQRESILQRQVAELKIEIDQAKRQRDVAEITESIYFQDLKQDMDGLDLEKFWA